MEKYISIIKILVQILKKKMIPRDEMKMDNIELFRKEIVLVLLFKIIKRKNYPILRFVIF